MAFESIRRVRAMHARVRVGFVEFLSLEASGSLVLLVATIAGGPDPEWRPDPE